MPAPEPVTRATLANPAASLSALVNRLLSDGVIYREDDEQRWSSLITLQARVRDYVTVMNLDFQIDEADGLAFLRGKATPESEEEEGPTVPRLVRRRALTYEVSLLLALLRKKLAEHEAGASRDGGDGRVVLTRETIQEMMSVFLADSSHQVKIANQIERLIGQVEELGFVKALKPTSGPRSYEVRRILRHFIDAHWLQGLDELLASYARVAAGEDPAVGEAANGAATESTGVGESFEGVDHA